MTITQVSVFVENRPGRLASLLAYLAEHNIDMRAYSFAETVDFGILRLLPCNAEQTAAALRAGGYTCTQTDVLALLVDDSSGATVRAFALLAEAGINVEYSYAFALQAKNAAIVLLRVSDNTTAAQLLAQAGIAAASTQDLY